MDFTSLLSVNGTATSSGFSFKALAVSVVGPLTGSVIGALLFSCGQVILQRLVPYLRSGAVSQAVGRICSGVGNPLRELLPEDTPNDMHKAILEIGKNLYRNSISTKPIADGFEYITMAYIYRIRLKLSREEFSPICVSVRHSDDSAVHEFHHKVVVEMKRDLEKVNTHIASKLSKWILENRVENYHCGENMVYILNTGANNRPVVIEVTRNPMMDAIHNANIRRHITGGIGNYTHYEPSTF